MARVARLLALLILVVGAGAWAGLWWQMQSASSAGGANAPGQVKIGGPFNLIGADGQTVTDQQFRGRFMLVYFGYTFCPDVCPTELQTVAASLAALGPDADKIAPLFITIDPERDTPKAMGEYTKQFDDRLIGLTGSAQQIATIAKEYRVYYARSDSKVASDYLMDHSSFIYLMGPDGTLRSLFRPGMSPQDLTTALKAQLTASGA